METPQKPSSHEAPGRSSWSILDGEFRPSDDFPNFAEVEIIKGHSADLKRPLGEELQRRGLYSELLVYALRYVNPSLTNTSVPEEIIMKDLIDEMANAMYELRDDIYRKQDVKKIAEERVDEPMFDPKTVPVMQALRRMQEAGAIDYDTRTILDAVVRAVHIRQRAKQSKVPNSL